MVGARPFHAAKFFRRFGDARVVRGHDDFAQRLRQLASLDDVLNERLAGDGMKGLSGETGRGVAGGDEAAGSAWRRETGRKENRQSLQKSTMPLGRNITNDADDLRGCILGEEAQSNEGLISQPTSREVVIL